jgi:hypothetical protein
MSGGCWWRWRTIFNIGKSKAKLFDEKTEVKQLLKMLLV